MKSLYIFLYYFFACKLPSSFFPLGFIWNRVRVGIMKKFIKVGEGTKIQQNVNVGRGTDIIIGSNCQVNENVKLQKVEIGDYVMIAPGVTVLGMTHKFDRIDIPMALQDDIQSSIGIIENDVWIGTNAIILPGIKIEKGCIIGAGAVVTKDCYQYGIYAGVPAKRIRERKDNYLPS